VDHHGVVVHVISVKVLPYQGAQELGDRRSLIFIWQEAFGSYLDRLCGPYSPVEDHRSSPAVNYSF
jgi:hypothetical protein